MLILRMKHMWYRGISEDLGSTQANGWRLTLIDLKKIGTRRAN